MKPLRRNNVMRKLHACQVFGQAGIICQGLLQYLAVASPQLVWNSFGSWLRTIRPGIPPSELVVATALRQSLPEFLLNTPKAPSSRNSSPNDRTPTKCRSSASPPDTQIPRKPRAPELGPGPRTKAASPRMARMRATGPIVAARGARTTPAERWPPASRLGQAPGHGANGPTPRRARITQNSVSIAHARLRDAISATCTPDRKHANT